eukprot:2996632-Rhodomonas_salina.1
MVTLVPDTVRAVYVSTGLAVARAARYHPPPPDSDCPTPPRQHHRHTQTHTDTHRHTDKAVASVPHTHTYTHTQATVDVVKKERERDKRGRRRAIDVSHLSSFLSDLMGGGPRSSNSRTTELLSEKKAVPLKARSQ